MKNINNIILWRMTVALRAGDLALHVRPRTSSIHLPEPFSKIKTTAHPYRTTQSARDNRFIFLICFDRHSAEKLSRLLMDTDFVNLWAALKMENEPLRRDDQSCGNDCKEQSNV
jgi:hypothetical protein